MTVNKKILDYIKIKGLSQSEIANKMNIAQSSLNRTLNADDLKISQLIALCKALEVSPTYFFDGTESINNAEVETLKKEIAFVNNLRSNDILHRADAERRVNHFVQSFCETLAFIFTNPKLLNKKFSQENIIDIVSSLRENVFCRYEYGLSSEKFTVNIVFIFNNPDQLPFEGEQYDSIFKAKD